MATGGKKSVTTKQIVLLAEVITLKNMDSIAMKYMNIEWEDLENLKIENKGDTHAFNRDVLRKWCYMNSGPNQVEVRFVFIFMQVLAKSISIRNFFFSIFLFNSDNH